MEFRKELPIYYAIVYTIFKAILKNGGRFQSRTSISETKKRRAFNFDSIQVMWGVDVRKVMALYYAIVYIILEAILKNGGHFQSSTSISETKRHIAFNIDYVLWAVDFRKKYCRIHNSFVSAILEAILKNGSHIQSNTNYIGKYETEDRHSLYPTFWKTLKKMAAIFKVIRIILETMRQRIVTLVSA